MKVLLVSTSEMKGGAAIAARRLLFALNSYGHDVSAKMLVRDRNTNCPDVVCISGCRLIARFKFAWERAVIWIADKFSRKNLFAVSIANTGFDITCLPEFREADIIHIHWTQQGMMSLRNMDCVFRTGKPVVLTMHDMWACTGGCHYSEACMEYTRYCSSCRLMNSCLSSATFARKHDIYSKYSFPVITCSNWLKGIVQSSTLLSGKDIHCIGNALDMRVFNPRPKEESRRLLGLSETDRYVLFVSQKVTDKRKGVDFLVEASAFLKDRGIQVTFLVMGKNSEMISGMLSHPCVSLGYIDSPEKAAIVYSAATMFVTPSLSDNLPNTIAESMACGTPCVGFNVGGIPEMIDHKENGYVAETGDAADLADGIRWVLENADYSTLSFKAFHKAETSYSETAVAKRHVELYESIMS